MKDILKEITPISSDDLFIVLNHPNADFDYPVHYHSEYEINLLIDAPGERIIGDSNESYGNLDLVIVAPNIPHAWKSDKIEGNHVITIQFKSEILNYPILNKNLFRPIRQLLVDSTRGIRFPEETMERISKRILKLTRMQGFHSVLEFLSILHDMATADKEILISNQYDIHETIRTSKSRRIAKVINYIDQNLSKPIKLAELADLVGMSESAFSHFFRKKSNITVINYINNLRVAKACQLLADTTNTVAEICFSCGFNNQSNFIRVFKKIKGQTPSDYRTYIQQMLIKY